MAQPWTPFGRERLGIGGDAAARSMEIDEPIATIGVLHGVENHDDLFEHLAGCGPAVGEQVIGRQERGVARGDLVAVNAVGHPDDRRVRLGDRLGLLGSGLARVGQAQVGLADLVEAGQVLGAGDRQIVEPALLDRLAVADQPGAVGRGLVESTKIPLDLGMARDVLAPTVADPLLERRHFRVGVDLGHRQQPAWVVLVGRFGRQGDGTDCNSQQ